MTVVTSRNIFKLSLQGKGTYSEFSGPYFPAFGLNRRDTRYYSENTDQKISEYGHFSRSALNQDQLNSCHWSLSEQDVKLFSHFLLTSKVFYVTMSRNSFKFQLWRAVYWRTKTHVVKQVLEHQEGSLAGKSPGATEHTKLKNLQEGSSRKSKAK